MSWAYVITSHWDDPDRTGRRCIQCDHAATHRARATHSVSGATDDRWWCTAHVARFAAERGLSFPCIAGRSAAPTVTVPRTA